MICPECKSEIPDNAMKCSHCGSKVGWTAFSSGCGCLLVILGILGFIFLLLVFSRG
ncbi:hypothetical protein ES707_08139 [subsurface metagenome]